MSVRASTTGRNIKENQQATAVFEEETTGDCFSDKECESTTEFDSPHPAATSVFVKRSVNLISCGSNAGKTTFCKNILLHKDIFFEPGSVEKIIYVNCNINHNRTHFENPYEEDSNQLPPVETYSLHELEDVASVLEKNSVVILDDVLSLNETVNYLVTYAANHLDCIIFIITQSCLSSPLFALIYKVHNLVLFFKNSSSIRLSHYLLSHFFISNDTKKYLREIFATAEQQKSIVLLKLNTVASSSRIYQKILAFANLQQLLDKNHSHCLVYPDLGHVEELEENLTKMDYSGINGDQFVLAQAKYLAYPKDSINALASGETTCAKKRNWDEMNDFHREEIQNSFPTKRWKAMFNLNREILRIKDFCISADFRRLLLKGNKKKANVSIIDFLGLATRRSFPGEDPEKYKPYIPFVKVMLKKQVPLSHIQNKKLLEIASTHKIKNT